MKSACLIVLCAVLASQAFAGWFDPEPVPNFQDKILVLENEIRGQNQIVDQWQMIAACLGFGCALLFIIGTALGAKTRNNYDGTRRMGLRPTNHENNPVLMAAESKDTLPAPLAA